MKLRRGQVLAIRFLDHMQGDGKPLELIAYGRLLSVGKKSLTIGSWIYGDPRAKQDPRDGNIMAYTILRSTIQSIDRLVAET